MPTGENGRGKHSASLLLVRQSTLVKWVRASGPKGWREVSMNKQVGSIDRAASCAEGLDPLPIEEVTE